MKTHLQFLFTLFLIVGISEPQVFAQDPIHQYEGIPLVIYPSLNTEYIIYPLHFQRMEDMGVYGAVAGDVLDSQHPEYLQHFNDYNLKVIPQYLWGNETFSHILRYTDVHYTIWEAEGTDPSNGKAALMYDTLHTNYFNEGDTIKGRWAGGSGVPENNTLIYGPGYRQNATYSVVFNADSIVNYTIEFRMKIDTITTPPPGYLDEIVCKVLVTETNMEGVMQTVVEKEVKVLDFNGLGNWATIDTTYDLYAYSYDQPETEKHKETLSWRQRRSYYTEFKVVWAGLEYLNLYIDRIRVYDGKGLDLIEQSGPGSPETNIIILVETYYPNDTTVIGWYAVDEPSSIDNYEPFSVVDNIISDATEGHLRLHTGFASGWNGRYGNFDKGTHPLYPPEEFYFRAKPKNLQMNLYNYHYPWSPFDEPPHYNPNWREDNIDKYLIEWNLDKMNNFDTSFAFSTQTGRWEVVERSIIPSPEQINYHVNIGLMYGARELRLDPFFSRINDNEVWGLVEANGDVTENYNFFRFTLIPRLNSSFGKTLRQIHQTEQHPNITASQTYKFIDHFSGNLDCLPTTANYDLGFFTDSELRDYFMIVSRWYNEEGVCPIFANLVENYFGFDNLSLTRYIADTTYTVLDDASILINLDPGDAELIRIVPVVKYGGNLIYNETISSDIELRGDLIIESGVTLTVNANYNCYGNITLNGGSISGNGNIYFHSNKRLTVNGNSQITGSSGNIEIDFIAPHTFNGIQVSSGSDFEIFNCIIRNSRYGIKAASNTVRLNIVNVDFYNCSQSGININGPSSSLPFIMFCNFYDLNCGVSANNLNTILVQSNSFNDTDLGLSMINVTYPYIFNNTLTSFKNTMPGIFLESSNGLISGNYISGHSNGILLGNSSPAIFENEITNNLYHGIYVGTGSLPNMSGQVFDDLPEYYAVSGHNTIIENGNNTSGGPSDNDGSEIYVNTNANIMMDEGCNSIIDDRVVGGGETPPYETIFLMNGPRWGTPIKIKASYNFWGNHPVYPLAERFGNLIVGFEPHYNEPCQYEEIPGEELFVTSSNGEIIDTLYPLNKEVGTLSETELQYASADKKFLTGDYEGSEIIYNQIINGNDSLYAKLKAYSRLYEIGKLNLKSSTYFDNLYNEYTSLSGMTEDSLMKKIFSQLGSLSLIGQDEYVPAIEEFDNIIQQNPETEEAIFAEIDALTAALLVEEGDTTLGKTTAGKYLNSTEEYGIKINQLLQKRFGATQNKEDKKLLPVSYQLYQNYPNPFNPTTTIKYDIIGVQDVKLTIYDILGREVSTLVNEQQQPGSYQVSWNASGVASGIYFYQLRTKDFVSTKKMILLR